MSFKLKKLSLLLFLSGFLVSQAACQKKAASTTTKAPEAKEEVVANPIVLIETKFGSIKVQLYDKTPLHRDNFIKLVKEGYYDETLFHRVINKFMIQGGDPNSKTAAPHSRLGSGGPNYTVPAEFVPEYIHVKGALCAARQGNSVNPKKASSGSQFYIVHGAEITDESFVRLKEKAGKTYTPEQEALYKEKGGTPFLDRDYTVFGMVIEGFDVLDKIATTPVDGRNGNRPMEEVRMKMSIVKE